jgi:hypothetical protein
MADDMEAAPAGGMLGGRQKRAFLVAAVLVLGVGLAIKLLGKQAAGSTPAATGTPDTSGFSAPPPSSTYNYFSLPGDPAGGMPAGGTTPTGTAGGTGTSGGVIHPPVGVVRNPIDPLGTGHNGLIPHTVISPGVPRVTPPVAPLPAGSDPAHYHTAPVHPTAAPVRSPAVPRRSILTPNFIRATLG